MLAQELSQLKTWFAAYAAGHHTGDPETDAALELKNRHTAMVSANARAISHDAGWPEDMTRLAQAAALLHDVGRFPQMAEFHTFDDRLSRDHAALGVETILAKQLLQNLTGKEQRQILSAVAWHNKRTPPPELPEDEQPLLYLTRDADKLDIMRLFTEYYAVCRESPNPLLEFALEPSDTCSEKILTDLFNGKTADLADARNTNDVRLVKLSWVYELYYPASRAIFLKNRYIEKTLATLPEIARLERTLTAYLEKNS